MAGKTVATVWDAMVYYRQNAQAVQLPPPICPKCGSHRTQIVGNSTDAKNIIRCNACGVRSMIGSSKSGGDTNAASGPSDLLLLETVGG